MRRIAIGDIHGCGKALRSLIEAIEPTPNDELVFVGDYVDRGPDSRDVVDQIIELTDKCRVVTLRGNHEIMLQGVALGGLDERVWLANGGQATLTSYGGNLDKIPADHLSFLQNLLPFYETSTEIFVHASYQPERDMRSQDDMAIYWSHLQHPLPAPHHSGKRVVVGHTPQPNGRILDIGHLICIDTYCFGGGCLTAIDVQSGKITQANRHGHLCRPPLISAAHQARKLTRNISEFCRKRFSQNPASSPAIDPPPSDLLHEGLAHEQE